MPEEVAATETTAAPDSSPVIEIPKDSEAYAKWRMTGELPGQPKEDSTPSHSEKPPAPEAGKPSQEKTQRRTSGADERLREILADLKEAGLSPSELKTFRREAQREERKPESRPEAREEPPPQQLQPPKKPVRSDYQDWGEYENARDKWVEEISDFKAAQRVAQDRQERAQQESNRVWREKLSEAGARYGSEAETAIVDTARAIVGDRNIHPAVKAVLDDSGVLTDLLYVMGSNEAALKEFVRLAREQPGVAIRKAVLLERLVEEELSKRQPAAAAETATPRDESGKFVSATPAKKVSQAPPPPTELGGRGGPLPDEAESAVKANDFRRFHEQQNRKQIAQIKGL